MRLGRFAVSDCRGLPIRRRQPSRSPMRGRPRPSRRPRAAIARVERIDPQLLLGDRASTRPRIDQARRVDASGLRGPLAGTADSDQGQYRGRRPLPTTAGSLALADNVTNRDAPLVARLRAAGMIIIGKTNLSEWANIRSNNSASPAGARSAARPATPMRSTATRAAVVERQRRGGRGGHRATMRSAPRPTARSPAPPRSTASSG